MERVSEPNQSELVPKQAYEKTVAQLHDLKKEIETVKELPETGYKYKRSEYDPEDKGNLAGTATAINKKQQESEPAKPFKIIIRSTADKAKFRLDPNSTKKQVNLNNSPQWRADFARALTEMQTLGRPTQVAGLDVAGKGLEAIHDLPLADQQVVMNHTLAYLRGERLREDLKGQVQKDNVEFEIRTEWLSDNDTRVASVIELEYSKAEQKPPEPPEKTDPPEPPEEPDLPLPPEEVPKIIETIEDDKFKISSKAILKGGWIGKTQEMTSSIVTRTDGRMVDTWFVIDKNNPENPKHYIAIDRSNQFRVLIGEMEYESGILNLEAKPGKILKAVDLDQTTRSATISSMYKILQAI